MRALLWRMPLRIKLVAAVLALVTVALIIISVASTVALQSYLVGRVDSQLAETARREAARGIPAETGVRIPVLPSDFLLEWRLPGARFLAYDDRYALNDLPPLPADMAAAERLAGAPYTVEALNGSSRWRVAVTLLPDGTALTVAQNMAEVDSAVSRLIWTEVVVGLAVLLLLAALSVAVIRSSLRPLTEIEQTAGAIATGDLSKRVPEPEPEAVAPRTEQGRLARALNVMLTQIEAAFAARAASEQRMRQFVADASHELRTPLTSIRGFAELYRQGAASEPEQADRLMRRIEQEAARMGLLVEDLLLLARLDQQRPLERLPVELPVIVSDSVHAARAVDPQRPIELVVESGGTPLVVLGDDARLRQVVGNLLSNALTHTPPGTPVVARLRAVDGMGIIEVIDQGPGLTPEQASRVFERFYRVDAARARTAASGGSGLGLAIVAALVSAHGGMVEVTSTPGEGATFRVRLPLAHTAETQGELRRSQA